MLISRSMSIHLFASISRLLVLCRSRERTVTDIQRISSSNHPCNASWFLRDSTKRLYLSPAILISMAAPTETFKPYDGKRRQMHQTKFF